MIRPLTVAVVFGLCFAVVLAALAWTSLHLLRFDAAQRESQSEARLEENVRLALWRMDSALAGLILQESVRPAADYQRVYYLGPNGVSLLPSSGSRRVASPLARSGVPYVVAHLQLSDRGGITSPQLPVEDAESTGDTPPNGPPAQPFRDQLEKLGASVAAADLTALVPPPPTSIPAGNSFLAADSPTEFSAVQNQQTRGAREFRRRSEYLQNNSVAAQNPVQLASADLASGLAGGVMTPLALEGHLLLARRVRLGGEEYLQICWLDRPAIEAWLSGLVSDLLPRARLQVAPAVGDDQLTRRLAALPLVLLPGELPVAAAVSPLRWSLAVAWLCVLLAGAAVGVLLTGVVSLSERRAAFVSAVTHELRTPLTTLRMYAEMLAAGMVPAGEDRRSYLETLHAEAERLGHLVENVLTYARLERGRGAAPRQTVSVGGLIDRVQGRLGERCRQAGMDLVVEAHDHVGGRTVRTDPASVEQIFFNLVDNACKYACEASDRRIHLTAAVVGDRVQLRVVDHGRGLSKQAMRRLFRPFSKSAEDAAVSAPGIGLGLSLCRRLARQIGGTFELDRSSDQGASFLLSLPVDDASQLARSASLDSHLAPPAPAGR